MDYIESLFDKLKKYLKNTNLKKSLGFYIIIAIISCGFCYLATYLFCEGWKNVILSAEGVKDYAIIYMDNKSYTIDSAKIPAGVNKKLLIFNLTESFSVFVYASIAIYLVSHIYYKNKLMEPLAILKKEIEAVGRNDFSLDCSYLSNDEIGEICQAFNQMRLRLIDNQKSIWKLVQDQRELNAAFAHDIRTPLTVMKGHTEILRRFHPKGQITEEKLLDTLAIIDAQADRLEQFADTMKEINTFEELELKRKRRTRKELYKELEQLVKGMVPPEVTVNITIEQEEDVGDINCDSSAILEVVGNLISNALRYSHFIQINLQLENGMLYLYIKDDGTGFDKKALQNAKKPYFTTEKGHFGLGLTICKLLCEKHGGSLELTNGINGGAIACASFFTA
ncbi:MAG: putative two-component sensor histidine kinase [Anaerocolumna sp.]|jgi:signal transduction histidine kinase|nr:putative two-component sensor histidine kinase [Anaerocolumna sp.]